MSDIETIQAEFKKFRNELLERVLNFNKRIGELEARNKVTHIHDGKNPTERSSTKPDQSPDTLDKLDGKYAARVESYRGKWSESHCKKPDLLARAGYAYKGPEDLVHCDSCSSSFWKWKASEDPWEMHAFYGPKCAFLINSRGEHFIQQVHQKYRKARLDSFKDWPAGHCMTAEVLAEAGFTFKGPGDAVFCGSCEATLSKWQPGDEAWEEHAYRSPHCEFVKQIKGQHFADLAQKRKKEKAILAEQAEAERRKKREEADQRAEAERRKKSEEAGLEGFDAFEVAALKRHNELRAKHGSPPLKLDRALCNLASDWARHMASQGHLSHRPGSGTNQGENCYYTSSTNVSGPQLAIDSTDSCYAEIKDFQFGYGGWAYNTAHFTAIVWRATTKMGIGQARGHKGTFVCVNFLPTGNMPGQFNDNVKPIGTPMAHA